MLKPGMPMIAVALLWLLAPLPVAAAEAASFDGQPTFSEGLDLGYFIWREGETWHVVWTTQGAMRTFSGSVEAEGGDLKGLDRLDVEVKSRIVRPGRAPHVVRGPRGRLHLRGGHGPVVATHEQDSIEKDGDHRIRFTARTNNDLDGFEFKPGKDVTSLRFVLEIDGQPRPQRVFVGKEDRNLPEAPLVVQLTSPP